MTQPEARAREAAYAAALPGRMRTVAADITAQMHADGTLPPGMRFEWG